MREITIYCTARDEEVRVLVDHDPLADGEESVLESRLICLEIGDRCNGACPMGAEPPTNLAPSWLARRSRPRTRSRSSRRAPPRDASQGGTA